MVKDKDGDYVCQYQPPVTVSSQKIQEYEKIRVEFEQGKVKDIKTTVK
jgi:hypothetical protein